MAHATRLPKPTPHVQATKPVVAETSALSAALSKPSAPPAPPAETKDEHAFGARFKNGLIIPGDSPHRLILFTFDDGPDKNTTPKLLDKLDHAGVKAVFFLATHRIRGENNTQRDQQEVAREIVRRGHIVASHTTDHMALPTLNDVDALVQIEGAQKIFEDVLGNRPWLFRAPYGAHSSRIDRLVSDRGYTQVMWNLGAGDFLVRTPEEVYKTWKAVLDRRESHHDVHGGIVLLHDTHAWSVEAFDLIYADLMARNCVLAANGGELFDIVSDPTFFFTARGDASPTEMAPPASIPDDVFRERQAKLREQTLQRCSNIARL